MFMVNNAIEPFSPEYVAKALAEWLPKASAAGITALFDAGMQVVPEPEGFAHLRPAGAGGKAALPGGRLLLPQQAGDRSGAGDPALQPGVPFRTRAGFGAEAEHRRRRQRSGPARSSPPTPTRPTRAAKRCCRPTCSPTSSGAPTAPASTSTFIPTATGRRACRWTRSRPRSRPIRRATAGTPSPTFPGRAGGLSALRQARRRRAVLGAMGRARIVSGGIRAARLGAARADELYRIGSILAMAAWCRSARTGRPRAITAPTGRSMRSRSRRHGENSTSRRPATAAARRVDRAGRCPEGRHDGAGLATRHGPRDRLHRGRQARRPGRAGTEPVRIPPHEIHKTKVVMTVMNGQVRHNQVRHK